MAKYEALNDRISWTYMGVLKYQISLQCCFFWLQIQKTMKRKTKGFVPNASALLGTNWNY